MHWFVHFRLWLGNLGNKPHPQTETTTLSSDPLDILQFQLRGRRLLCVKWEMFTRAL